MSTKKRLMNELREFQRHPIPGITIHDTSDKLDNWIMDLHGALGTLYDGEQFQLQFKFCDKYPFDSPEVIFTGSNIPIHPHIYGNGHICLSILTSGWSPALSVQSVCLSILSMLSSCKQKMTRFDDNPFIWSRYFSKQFFCYTLCLFALHFLRDRRGFLKNYLKMINRRE